MVCKRPFLDEESYDVGSKHPRQHGETAQQSPVWGITHFNDGPQKQFSGNIWLFLSLLLFDKYVA